MLAGQTAGVGRQVCWSLSWGKQVGMLVGQ